jgi:hypothetical protein
MISLASRRLLRYPPTSECKAVGTACVREADPRTPKPRLLDRVREPIRARHYSHRTEKAYTHWIKRYIFFHDKRVLHRPRRRPAASSPSPRVRSSAGSEGRRARRRNRQASHLPHVPALIRHPPARGRAGHPYRPGVARTPGCQHHHDLHARPEPRAGRGQESGRSDVPIVTTALSPSARPRAPRPYLAKRRKIRRCPAGAHSISSRRSTRHADIPDPLDVLCRTAPPLNEVQERPRSA